MPEPIWKEYRLIFRQALLDAFNADELRAMLLYHCDGRKLEEITSQKENVKIQIDEILGDAERKGWLEVLAKGSVKANDGNVRLKECAAVIIEQVRIHGQAWYQPFTIYKSPTNPALMPLYKRLSFLEEIEDTDTGELREKIADLIAFVKTWDRGDYYAKEIRNLTAYPLTGALRNRNDQIGRLVERANARNARNARYRKKLIDNRDRINELISELLLSQSWYTG